MLLFLASREFLVIRPVVARQGNKLLTSIYVFLPLLILTTIVAFKWNKIKRFWNREETYTER